MATTGWPSYATYQSYVPVYWNSLSFATTWNVPFSAGPALVSLPSVTEAPAELSDREWLDAQVNEVCLLAA